MANVLEISILSPAIGTNIISGLPTKQEQLWGDFLPLENYFPEIHFLESTNVGSASLKNQGYNIPGSHGIFPTYSPVSQTTKRFTFYARSRNSETEVRNKVKEFIRWIYSLGEFRICFNGETQYRRMIYNSGTDYEMLNGVYGYDARFELILTCVDSLSYAKEYINIPVNPSGTTLYTAYRTIVRQENTIDYTPLIVEHDLTNTVAYTNMYFSFFVNFDGKNIYFFNSYIDSNNASSDILNTPYKLVINGETSEFYILKNNTRIDLINYIRSTYSPATSNDFNYLGVSFPFIMAGRTFIDYTINTRPLSTSLNGTVSIKYRPRVLAYD